LFKEGPIFVSSRAFRLAIIVSHPIQYYAPLYQKLAARDDIDIKVFFTWHAGVGTIQDRGFQQPIKWDIPLTVGYDYDLVPNVSSNPGTDRFFGLRNPTLVRQVEAWGPDVVHITGWAWFSHLMAMRAFARNGTTVLFRGDSHLLDEPLRGLRWRLKRAILTEIFSWPTAFLVTGSANRAYYEAFNVGAERLLPCPHSIDVGRFSGTGGDLDRQSAEWRQQIGISSDSCVLLYAGKFERKKRPLELMQAVRGLDDARVVLLMVGDGELNADVCALAAADTKRFVVLPFQNQSRMPLVYRLGDLFVLPSAYNETWGLAVNEAMACGRPVLVSDRVGCAKDVVDPACGQIFSWEGSNRLDDAIRELVRHRGKLAQMGQAAAARSWAFDTAAAAELLVQAVKRVSAT
jgi:glycosyltransferase involved in cell wall biosynthesis